MTVAYISHSDCGRHDTGWGHPEHVGRLRAIPRALRDDAELFHALTHVEGRHATPDELALAHDPAYVRHIQQFAVAGGGRLDADTVASEGSWEAATASTGCVLDGVDMAFDGRASRSFSAVRPPGHHALASRAMGFCLFGNIALAAHYARTRHGIGRVLIADWDVHHGNGTQALVEREADIHFVSMHQWPWYPGTGAAEDRGPHRTVWNVPMPGGQPRERYVEAWTRAIDSATDGWQPDLVLISAGFDSLNGDPLGAFTLEIEDFVSMHQWPWYPGTGAAEDRGPHRTVWNVPRPGGQPRERYIEAWTRAIDSATDGWQPDLVLISAGFDSLNGDPLGAFTLEVEDFVAMTRDLVARAEVWCGGRIVSALEGGYAPERMAAASVAHLRALI